MIYWFQPNSSIWALEPQERGGARRGGIWRAWPKMVCPSQKRLEGRDWEGLALHATQRKNRPVFYNIYLERMRSRPCLSLVHLSEISRLCEQAKLSIVVTLRGTTHPGGESEGPCLADESSCSILSPIRH